jgi:hypothetical protein
MCACAHTRQKMLVMLAVLSIIDTKPGRAVLEILL